MNSSDSFSGSDDHRAARIALSTGTTSVTLMLFVNSLLPRWEEGVKSGVELVRAQRGGGERVKESRAGKENRRTPIYPSTQAQREACLATAASP